MFLAFTIAVIAALTFVELRFGSRLSSARMVNISVWAGRILLAWVLFPLVALSVTHSLIDSAAMPFAAGFALYVLVMDIGEYSFHRAQHSIPWLWKLHALHHSDPDMNVTTTERHFWGDQFIKSVTIWPAAAFIVHPTGPVVFCYALVSLWNYVGHSRIPLSFGRFSWLLNSPAYHRRHHSALPEHFNSNFAALFPLWDVLLGSYRVPARALLPTGLGGTPPHVGQIATWPVQLRGYAEVGTVNPASLL